jgi:hypothetical protein
VEGWDNGKKKGSSKGVKWRRFYSHGWKINPKWMKFFLHGWNQSHWW